MYKMTDTSVENLEAKGFQFSTMFSTEEEPVYYKRFPVYRHELSICFECELRVFATSGECIVNVYDSNSVNRYACYASWYNRDYGRNEVVEIIDRNIDREMRKCGIVKDDHSG